MDIFKRLMKFFISSQWAKINLCACVPSYFSHAQFCKPMDYSPPGSSIHGIFQARILEWVVIPFSNELPNPEIKPRSPALQADSLPSKPPGKPQNQSTISFKNTARTSLEAQWIRIHLPMQRTRVRSLVQEDSTCCGATRPVCHDYWARALEPSNCNYWNPCALKPVLCNKRNHSNEKPENHKKRTAPALSQLEESPCPQWKSSAAINE